MMIRNILLSAALLAGASLAAQQAAAQTATIKVTGTVTAGYDASGTFGAAQANLAGLPFSAIFTVTPKPGDTVINTGSLAYLFGMGAASPVSAALSIGTGTQFFGGTFSGSARALNGVVNGSLGTDSLYYSSEDTDLSKLPSTSTLFYVGFDSLRDLLAQPNYSSYSTINLTAADNAQGYAQIANFNSFGLPAATTYATLSLSTISGSVAAPVPEPATWAMMIVGFGLAGAALRRQRTRTQARIAFA